MMVEALVVSNLLLWCLIITLALVVFALTRQIGVLNERVAPAGALTPTTGPKIGETTEIMSVEDLLGTEIKIGGESPLPTLILFVSPTCPVCRSLVPTAKSLAQHEELKLVFASDGDTLEKHQAYAKDLKLDSYPYVLSQALGMGFGVSKLPFAVLIAKDGTLAGKGLVNTREHLESLVESMLTGVATLQEYVQDLNLDADNTVKEYVP
ncbi:MAG: thiol-disulfide isomerase [Gammaproteobacteria bacterium]|nr:thiol-disulfide isomerase [Gammaproteobacteria bacterium]